MTMKDDDNWQRLNMMIMIMIIIKVTVKNHEQERAHGNDLEAVSGKVRVKV